MLDNRGATVLGNQVSFESELLILVDDEDREIGNMSKSESHDGDGVLHRAFSLFIFNDEGKLLLQQRNADKRLWPMYWANSCCSHPRYGETMELAVNRRLQQELGMSSELKFLFKFKYQASFGDLGSEHEWCWVYVGHSNDPVQVNKNEIAASRFVTPEELDREIASDPDFFTPWLKLEWKRLRQDYSEVLSEVAARSPQGAPVGLGVSSK